MNTGNKKQSLSLMAIKKLYCLISVKQRRLFFLIIFLALSVSFLELLTAGTLILLAKAINDPNYISEFISKIFSGSELSSTTHIMIVSSLVGIIYLIKNIIASFEVFFQNFSIQKMCYIFKNKLLSRYTNADFAHLQAQNSSFGLQVLSSDAELSFTNGMAPLAIIISEGIIFLSLISMIVFIEPSLTSIILIVMAIIYYTVSKLLLPLFYSWGQKAQETRIQTIKDLMQFFHAYKEIVLHGSKGKIIDEYKEHSKALYILQARQTATNALPRLGIEVIFVGLFVLTVLYLCISNESSNNMMGLLGGYLYAGFRVMPGLNRIINQLNTFKSAIPSINRVYDEWMKLENKARYIDAPGLSFNKHINIKGLSYKYPKSNNYCLSNINLTIYKGECIGIIGETGSGKSTLVDIILGLLEPQEGKVLIDDSFSVKSIQWHNKIGYVAQNFYLIDSTIKHNIAFGEHNIDEKKLHKAIESSQLNDLIKSLPQGVNTVIGERGVRLSGGEQQRIAIARALYRSPEIIIFDEATSSLDDETEKKLMTTINSISKEHTVIMIAHRTTTLSQCNRIILIKDRTINLVGSYDDMCLRSASNH